MTTETPLTKNPITISKLPMLTIAFDMEGTA